MSEIYLERKWRKVILKILIKCGIILLFFSLTDTHNLFHSHSDHLQPRQELGITMHNCPQCMWLKQSKKSRKSNAMKRNLSVSQMIPVRESGKKCHMTVHSVSMLFHGELELESPMGSNIVCCSYYHPLISFLEAFLWLSTTWLCHVHKWC